MRQRSLVVAILLILIMLVGCKGPQPDKIDRLGMLSSKADGTKVEFSGWVEDVLGDSDLNYELVLSESAKNYPYATVGLKDGQKPPEKDRFVCVRAKIVWRQDSAGSVRYQMTEGEIIECY